MPKVNQNLYFQIEPSDPKQPTFRSRIADVSDDTISIEIPINESTGRLKKLVVGDQLSAYYVSDGGVKNYFHTIVLGDKEDIIKLIVIQRPDPDSITKVQRRNYLRVPAELEVAVQLAGTLRFVAVTEDVSGGGLSFICGSQYSISPQDDIACWLLLQYRNEMIDHAYGEGKAVRVKQLETGKQLVMMSFTEISHADQQKIMKYCFERQLELRK